jgi:signal transduction histidine kinase
MSDTRGLALLCDADGNITHIVRDDLGVSAHIALGQPLVRLVERGSLVKALNFLTELKTNHAVFDWEMNVPVGESIVTLHFTGGKINAHFLIVAALNGKIALALYEEMMRMGNEQTNALRAALKAQAETTRAHVERDSALYNEISRLNNELVAMQRELAKKNAELERLNALKNQFLGMAAHDLRNPLSVIMSYSEFLMEDVGASLGDQQREFLNIIRSSSEFMLRLVNDLLDIAQIEAGQLRLDLQPTDLVALVRHNIALNRVLAAKKHIEIQLSDEPLPRLPLDASKIEQVLNNLIGNAIKFSSPHTTITVRVTRPANDSTSVLLAVQDQGPGIPPNELDKLFKPFQRTSVKSPTGEKSTGLGLTIVKKIVEGHNGKIWVESQVGKGTVFFVALPLQEGNAV